MKNRILKKIKNEKGSILVMVLMIFIIATITCTSIMMIGTSSINMSKVLEDQKKAHLLAWSGLEAVEVAWRDFSYSDQSKFVGDIKRVYYSDDGVFSVNEPSQYVGYVELKVVKDSKGKYVIESTGVVNEARQTIRSQSSPLETKGTPENSVTGDSDLNTAIAGNQWLAKYKYTKGCGSCNRDGYAVLFLPGTEEVGGTYDSKPYTLKFHPFVPGVVVLNPDLSPANYGDDIYIYPRNGDYNKIGYMAHTIFFQQPINLKDEMKNSGCNAVGCSEMAVVVVSAENIIFEQELKVLDESTRFSGLAMHLPPGLGVSGEKILLEVASSDKSKIDPKRLYGRVYFSQVTVNGRVSSFSNKSFYFLPDKESSNDKDDAILISKDDLFTYRQLLDTGRLIPIDSNSSERIPMQPDQYLQFVRFGGSTD